MMIYATYSSGTLVVSELIQNQLQASGHTVTLMNASETDHFKLQGYDLIMMGTPSWWNNEQDGQPHHDVLKLIDKMKGRKVQKLFAIYGLGDSSYARLCNAVDILDEFVKSIEGTLFIPSLKVDSFYFEQKKNEELIKNWTTELISKINSYSI